MNAEEIPDGFENYIDVENKPEGDSPEGKLAKSTDEIP